MKKLLKFIIKSNLVLLILLLAFISSSYFIFTTTIGAKLLLTSIIFLSNKKITIHKISGNLKSQLTLEKLHVPIDNINNLQIKIVNIKVNWPKLIKQQLLSLAITNLEGSLNNHSINANLNFAINKQQLSLNNSKNFIQIGNNILNFEQATTEFAPINFKLIAKQYNAIITGNILNDLSKLTATVTFKPFLDNNNNKLNIIILNNKSDKKFLEANINIQDISHIMKFIPDISRLKGKLQGSIKIFEDKNIDANLSLNNITMSLPEYGIKIKPLHINFTANNSKIININGKGFMRNGPGEFNLKGHIEPFSKNFINSLAISGNNIECINIPGYHLIASLQLKLAFLTQQNNLQLTGNIIIPSGTIDLDQQKTTSIVKSKDIILLDSLGKPIVTTNSSFKISPNIDLKIEPETKLLGKGLDTVISGKLKIYTENDSLFGSGRITIKHGVYKLSGQEYLIEKGRIIYLPGTLIANPSLDIKILPKNSQKSEQYLYVEGTLTDPIIKDSGLINEHQAMLQLLSFGSNKLTENIKEKLHLQEFGIQEDYNLSNKFKNKPTDESVLQNKHFVIGKKINNKIHLQYLKTLNSVDNTVRLKYNISSLWSLGIESSTEAGHGADLEFFLEK